MSLAILWLLTVSAADAAPTVQRARHAHVCDAQTTTIHKVMRRLKALGGPLSRMRRARAGLLFDFTPRLHRTTPLHVDDDGDAIQSSAGVASVDPGHRALPGLRSLGIVAGSVDRHRPTLLFSPRSPRGPPLPI